MNINDLLRDLARAITEVPERTGELRDEFIRACRRFDDDPREQQRIDDIADLLDAEETLYAQARAAADHGDTDTAVPLLRQCAEVCTGEAAWLLAQLLEDLGNTTEASIWYQRAHDDGDNRAAERLAALHARPRPHADNTGSPRDGEHAVAAIQDAPETLVRPGHSSHIWPTISAVTTADFDCYAALRVVLVQLAYDAANVHTEGLLSKRILRFMVSDPGIDHARTLKYICAALSETRNYLAHDPSWMIKDRLAAKLAKNQLEAREFMLARGRTPASMLWLCSACSADQSQASAAWALRWRRDCEDQGRPCPTNLGRLYAAGQWDARRPAREPIAADVMLPRSEVPECAPDTALIQALERLVQSGTQALPVCERSRVAGIVTLADLARHINDHQGVPSATKTVKALMRPATIVPAHTPLSAIAQAIADDSIIVISGSGDRPVGYLTAESVLTQTRSVASARPTAQDSPPLLIPAAGAVLLDGGRLSPRAPGDHPYEDLDVGALP